MIEPTRIGFSTTDALLSRLIRRLTRSKVSHAWLVYHDVDFDREMVMEAVGAGFRIVPLDKFARHNRIVPRKFVSISSLASSIAVSSTAPDRLYPALLTTTSRRPSRSKTHCTPCLTDSSERTSMGINWNAPG